MSDQPAEAARFLEDPDSRGAYVVRLHGADQSYVDPDDPLRLEFDYIQRIATIIDETFPKGERLRVIHLGGGGLTLPRWVAATRPTSHQTVCEPDSQLVADVRENLPLPPRSGIKIREIDARGGLPAFPDGQADVVILDAFNGGRVPADVTTTEAVAQMARVLKPTGVLLANLTDTGPLAYTKRVARTVRQHFAHALVGAEPPVWKGRRMGNVIVAASGGPLPHERLTRLGAGGAFPWRLLADVDLDRWAAAAPLLSDANPQESPRVQGVYLAL